MEVMNSDDETSPDKISTENFVAKNDQSETSVDLNSKKHQEARAFLREKYLRVITLLVGHSCKFNLVDGNCVSGTFSGSDADSKRFYVKNLVTPIGAVSDALLRSEDIVSFHISGINI